MSVRYPHCLMPATSISVQCLIQPQSSLCSTHTNHLQLNLCTYSSKNIPGKISSTSLLTMDTHIKSINVESNPTYMFNNNVNKLWLPTYRYSQCVATLLTQWLSTIVSQRQTSETLTETSSPFKQLSDKSSISSTFAVSHFDCTISISRLTPLDVITVWHKFNFVGLECIFWTAGIKQIKPTQKFNISVKTQ